jgi:SAM-dependent methyltransferase
MSPCPVCAGIEFSTLVPSDEIESECRSRERFIRERLSRPASKSELKDLTDFFHQGKAEILSCTGCQLLVRSELESPPAETYSEDDYDPKVIEDVYPKYLHAFREKEKPYRSLLPEGAHVLEIGSHYGAFLQTAQEWGWNISGVDVGEDTSRFARSKGFVVHKSELQDCQFPDHAFDAVFIWNCFEQIGDPKPVLREARRITKPGGLFVVRTPNGLFYELCRRLLASADLREGAAEFLHEAMAYNNLLGFPYLFGHSRETLERLIQPLNFRLEGMLNSELITLPLPANPSWVEHEERVISSEVKMLASSALSSGGGELLGPWIEIWFRC